METIKIESYKDFVKIAQTNMIIVLRGKTHVVIDISSDYTIHNNGTYEEVIILKELFTGKYVGFTYEQLKGKRVTYGYTG